MTGTEQTDVVVVGGGIAGSSLAAAMAQAGIDTVVLERQRPYRDQVKGENILPWGLAEARHLGLYDTLATDAEGHPADRGLAFSAALGPEHPNEIRLADVVPGAHTLNFQHPAACAALAGAATLAGATAVEGVGKVSVRAGRRPGVTYDLDGQTHSLDCRLVVGADGRNSSVRKQVGMRMRTRPANHVVGGLLVDGLQTVPMDAIGIGVSEHVFALSFPQGEGRSRLYACPPVADKGRYSGPGGADRLLADMALDCVPWRDDFGRAEVIGPCRTYSGDDTVVDDPRDDGVLLVGDAAGYTSPIIGMGLSSAMRDARLVVEALTSADVWDPPAFDAYVDERAERMRRIHFIAAVQSNQVIGPGALERAGRAAARTAEDPVLGAWRQAQFFGPETVPAEAFDDAVFDRLFAPA